MSRTRGAIPVLALGYLAACGNGGGEPLLSTGYPGPFIDLVAPHMAFPDEALRFEVQGRNFAGPSRTTPTLTVTRIRDAQGNPATGPSLSAPAPAVDIGVGRERAFIDVAQGALPAGVYAAELSTDRGAVRYGDAFIMWPYPSVTPLDASCASPSSTIGIDGEFYSIGAPPFVRLITDAWTYLEKFENTMSGCRSIPFDNYPTFQDLALCSHIEVPIPQSFEGGPVLVAVDMIPVVINGGIVPLVPAERFGLFQTAVIERKDSALYDDLGLFSALDGPVAVPAWRGAIASLPGLQAAVTIDGAQASVSAIGCAPSLVPGFTVCSGLDADIPMGAPTGNHTLEVTTAGGCRRSHSFALAPRPVISSLQPAVLCARALSTVEIHGSGFARPWPFVNGVQGPAPWGCGASADECVVMDTLWMSIGTYEIAVTNESQPPVRSNPAVLTVAPGPPSLGEPWPRVVFAGARRPILVPATDITGQLLSAALLPQAPAGAPVPVEVRPAPDGAELTYPGLGDANEYSIEIRDQSPCPGTTTLLRAVADPVWLSWDFESPWMTLWTITDPGGTAGPLVVSTADGNPGAAILASRDAPGPDWYFYLYNPWDGYDLGTLRFDLRVSGSGNDSAAPAVIVPLASGRLEYTLARPPPGAWSHFDVPLDGPSGWTYRDGEATRPATVADFRWGRLGGFWILGSWWTGPTSASLDNLVVEYVR